MSISEWTESRRMKRPVTRRCSFYPTFRCNADCIFCYFKDKIKTPPPDMSIEFAKQRLSIAQRVYNLEWLDLSGGEPSLYPYLRELIEYSKKIGIKLCLITNGLASARIKKAIEWGIDDIILSVEGYSHTHDHMVGVRGGFGKLVITKEYLLEHNFKFRTNSVMTGDNLPKIIDLAYLLYTFKPRIVNFICFNPHTVAWRDSKNVPFQPEYKTVAIGVKRAVDYLKEHDIWANVRYLPLCLARGWEEHICGMTQNVYDPYEWVGFFEWNSSKEHIRALAEDPNTTIYGKLGSYERACNVAVRRLLSRNIKPDKCKNCANEFICDGIHPQYLKNFGDSEFIPIPGEKIIDPIFYRLKDTRWRDL